MLDAWLDLVHGSRCIACGSPGRALCRPCAASLPLAAHRVRPTPCPSGLAPCFAAGEYAGLLRDLVLAHKEHAVLSLAGPLGLLLAAAARPAVTENDVAAGRAVTVLVPVPSRPEVVRARGHDPMLRVTRAAARVLAGEGHRVELLRLLHGRVRVADQAGLDHRQRAANLHGSMAVRDATRRRVAGGGRPVAVVVCDDVLTTGATAREAQRALEDSGLVVRAVATVAATRRRLPSGIRGDAPRGALPL